ncbi:MAG: F0F1 ATP synthase subunit epsilon [Bradyrhizobium sp.]|uniref:F0F1 ATP synthase subunit epsilon n=1 Tax=Bradyrhizobium sp. TaxID=376 RepID=UPI0025C6B5F5|nr:F0F1 ATP synthase subunit epsilon [Bradyrhizobium sp.]MBI5263595.1 F0F1 ATP synthase subunit epsilon [Bradyrhizobium sp.]
MPNFQMSLVSPAKLLFAEAVAQVDLPGAEGDFGVLSGHAPMVALLRPGIITAIAGDFRERFVVFGGLAEFSDESLTVLAEDATPVEEFDVGLLEALIDEMQEGLAGIPVGAELDEAIARLDHYKSIQAGLTVTTAL